MPVVGLQFTVKNMKTIIIHALCSSILIIWIVLVLALCPASAQNEYTDAKPVFVKEEKTTHPELFAYPVIFFQKFISGADGDRCVMFPSCSNYCIQAFKKHGALMGWIMTCDRLLRCGRDETRHANPVWINGKKHFQDAVADNDFWWYDSPEDIR